MQIDRLFAAVKRAVKARGADLKRESQLAAFVGWQVVSVFGGESTPAFPEYLRKLGLN